jgi:hypothetical protein
MPNPFEHEDFYEIQRCWVGYTVATHLIVGWVPGRSDGGIIGSASDQFTAYRAMRLAKRAGFEDVQVMPNDVDAYLLISERMSQQLRPALGF